MVRTRSPDKATEREVSRTTERPLRPRRNAMIAEAEATMSSTTSAAMKTAISVTVHPRRRISKAVAAKKDAFAATATSNNMSVSVKRIKTSTSLKYRVKDDLAVLVIDYLSAPHAWYIRASD
jgi:hypothetical protein